MIQANRAAVVFDTDSTRVDLDRLWGFLSEHAYWGRWRTRDDVGAQLTAAWRVVGVYQAVSGEMIGFARAVSDGVAFAYLADAYIDRDHRGQGLGRELIRVMIDEGPGRRFRWMLHTADAHQLYRDFGFEHPDATVMERPARHVFTS